MDEQQIETNKRLAAIFMPYAWAQLTRVRESGKRFVHYSSAENIYKIISSQTMWMRNTKCMADYSEVELGYGMLQRFFHEDHNMRAFRDACNAVSDNLAEESIALFDQWWADIRFNTYICSISEHEDSEDGHGRLSMWRAFGQSPSRAGWSCGCRRKVQPKDCVSLESGSVFGQAEIEEQLQLVVRNINDNGDYLRTINRDHLKSIIFMMLVSGAVCIKHIGFQEEREWRVIYLPRANPSPLLTSSTEVIAGVPQIVHKIPLLDNREKDVVGVGIPALVDKVIIGPTVYAAPMYAAFVAALADAGVQDANTKVVVSGIPLRS